MELSEVNKGSPVPGTMINLGLIQKDASGELLVLTDKGLRHAQSIREYKQGPPRNYTVGGTRQGTSASRRNPR